MKDLTELVIYNSAIEAEKEKRKTMSANDLRLLEGLLQKIRELGFNECYYLADITNRKFPSKSVVLCVLDTILKWDDKGIEAMLVGCLKFKGLQCAVDTVIASFTRLTETEKFRYQAFYDNTLVALIDKKHFPIYLEWAKCWKKVACFPLLMECLCRRNVEHVIDLLIAQALSKEDFCLFVPNGYTQRNQAFVNAISSLAKCPTYEERIIATFEEILEQSNDKNIKECTVYALKKYKSKFKK